MTAFSGSLKLFVIAVLLRKSSSMQSANRRNVTIATVWAHFRQLSMKELYSVTTQLDEEVLFQISYRAGLTTSHMIQFRGVQYDIVRIDTFEGYKANLKLYCKRKK